jgi:hypothetical protein
MSNKRDNVIVFPLVKVAGVPSAEALQHEYEALLRKRDREHGLPKSVRDLAEWLAYHNPERLKTWLFERPERERDSIVAYLREKL